MGILQMLKPKSFRGRCPLDPRRGSAPLPRQWSLERKPGPFAVRRSARFARPAFMDSKSVGLTRRTNTQIRSNGPG